ASLDILIAALAEENEETTSILVNFAMQGGTIISYGGLNNLAAAVGCEFAGNTEVGYARLSDYEKVEAIRFLQARPWRMKNAGKGLVFETGSIHKDRPDGVLLGSALQKFTIGSGALERWSVDIPGTIVKLQQGTEPVLTDGAPAPDGTGPVNEN